MDKSKIKRNIGIFISTLMLGVSGLFSTTNQYHEALADSSYTPVIDVEDKVVHRGQTFTVDVNLKDNEGLISLYLSLDYNSEAMRLINVEKGVALDSLTFTMTNSQTEVDFDIKPFVLLWDGNNADSSNGKLLTLTFESFATAAIGDYPINFTYDSANTNKEYGVPVPLAINNGIVTLQSGEYEAIYYDWDNKGLYRKDFNSGDVPSYGGETPIRNEDEYYSYAFKGWKGLVSDDPHIIKYQADYSYIPQIYNVFYYVDGVNNDSFDGVITIDDFYKAEEVAFGTYLEIEAPIKGRYIFSGWFIDDKFETPFEATTMPARDLSLYGYFIYDIRTTQIPKIKLTYKEDGKDYINVYADMVLNTGFNGMVLTLSYDKNALKFVNYQKTNVFKEMQFDTTHTDSLPDVDNFKFYYEHSENTYETGVFLVLRFQIVNESIKGVFDVDFKIGNTDATYINGEQGIRYTDIEIVGAKIPLGKIYRWEKRVEDDALVTVTSSIGMPSDTVLKASLVPQSVHKIENAAVKDATGKNNEIMAVYKIELIRIIDGMDVEVEPEGILNVEIKLTNSQKEYKTLQLLYINDKGEIAQHDSNTKDDTLSFETDHLSLWSVVGEKDASNGGMSSRIAILVIMPILLAIATMSYVLILLGKRKKIKEENKE